MKKIFTLMAILFSITTFAAEHPGPKTSKISIATNDRSVMQVKIDGVTYNLNNTFVLDNIRPGNHSITIFKTESFGFRKRTQVVYNSSLFISPSQLVNININRMGKVVVSQSSMDRYDRDDRFKGNKRGNNGRNYDSRDDRYGRY
jgi:hypothetical protein